MKFHLDTTRAFSLSKKRRFALFSGAIGALAFFPIPIGGLIFVAFVPLLLLLEEIAADQQPKPLKRIFREGYAFGLTFNFGLLYWIAIVRPILVPAMFAGVAYVALYYALMAMIAVWLRKKGFSLQLTMPFLWLALDFWLNQTELAIPWGNLGYALSYFPNLIQFISITGTIGATFFIMLINCLIFDAIRAQNRRKWIINLSLVLLMIGSALIHGSMTISRGLPPEAPTIRVGVIQPSYPMSLKWADEFEDYVIQEQLDMSAALKSQKPDLIVWSETAVPAYVYYKPLIRFKLAEFARQHQIPLFVGAPHAVFEGDQKWIYNAAFLFDVTGKISPFYAKMYLVPFAERMPYQEYLPILQKYDLGQANFSIGKEFVIFEADSTRFGAGICYETVFPHHSRGMVAHGAQFLVTITNDTWFGPSTAPFQHANMHRMRCIENRVSLARCANSGVSLFADPFGRIISQTAFYDVTTLIADIPLHTETTFYTRYGDLFTKICLMGLLLILLSAISQQFHAKRKGKP